MSDLATQLRDYLDETAPAVGLEEILAEPVGTPPVRRLAPRRVERHVPGWVYAVAVAAAILLLVGGVAWLLRPQATVAPADQPTTTTPTTTGSESLGVVGEWSIHAPTFDASQAPLSFTDAAVTPFGLFAAGYRGFSEVWRSDDGIEWNSIDTDDIEYERPSFSYIEGSELGLVLISPGNGVWFSSDGNDWSRVPDLAIEGDLSYIAVAAASQRGFLVAVNEELFFSGNGRAWTQVDAPFSGSGLVRVAANDDAFFATLDRSSGVWRSTDGLAWEPLPLGRVIDLCDIAASSVGVVIVGCNGTIWYSPEGTNWTHHTDVLLPWDDPNSANFRNWKVGASHAGFLIAGFGSPEAEQPRAWFSPDGLTWTPIPSSPPPNPTAGNYLDYFGDQIAYEILPLNEGFVGIGEQIRDGQRPVVWTYTP